MQTSRSLVRALVLTFLLGSMAFAAQSGPNPPDVNWGLLEGLVAIVVGIIFGVLGLRSMSGVKGTLKRFDGTLITAKNAWSTIQSRLKLHESSPIADFVCNLLSEWDFVRGALLTPPHPPLCTVERVCPKLGKVKIEAVPNPKETLYTLEFENCVLNAGWVNQFAELPELLAKEKELLGKESRLEVMTPETLVWHVPCADADQCTAYMSFALRLMDSKRDELIRNVAKFEEPIKF